MSNSTGTELPSSVEAIGSIHFEGNVIPHSWFQHILWDNGAPDIVAIVILSDIIYWYRPVVIRDETTGHITGYRKKFAADHLQRDYSAFASLFGFSRIQVKRAIDRLKDLKLITTYFKHVRSSSGQVLPNCLFLEPLPEAIRKITYQLPLRRSKDTLTSVSTYHDVEVKTCTEITTEKEIHVSDIQNDVGRPCFDESKPSKKRLPKKQVLLSEMSQEAQERWSKFMDFLREGMAVVPEFVPLDFSRYVRETPFLVATFMVERTAYAPTWRVRSTDLSGWFHEMDRLIASEEQKGDGWTWEHVREVIEAIFAEEERPTSSKDFRWGKVIQSVPNLREHFLQIEETFFPNGAVPDEVQGPKYKSWEEIGHNYV